MSNGSGRLVSVNPCPWSDRSYAPTTFFGRWIDISLLVLGLHPQTFL